MNKLFNKILAKKAVKYRLFIIILNSFGFLFFYPFILFNNLIFKQKTPKKIAIMRPDNIGDLVMITPMFKPIKEKYPGAELFVLCQTQTRKLLEADNSVKISEFNPFWLSRSKHSIKGTFRYVLDNFRKYDLLFEVRGDPFCEFFSFLLAKKRIGFYDWGGAFFLNQSFAWEDDKHRVENNLRLLSPFMDKQNYIDSDQKLTLVKSEYVDSFFENKEDSHKIILHPYAGQKQRDFPDLLIKDILEKFSTLQNVHVYITGSPKDSDKIEEFLKQYNIRNNNFINVCGKFDLQQFPYFVSKCDLVICPDTSIAHIAATLKKPQVCLYGQKKQKTFYPYKNPNSLVLLNETKCKYIKKGRCTNSNCKVHMEDFTSNGVFDAINNIYDL